MIKFTASGIKKFTLITTAVGVTVFSVLIEFMDADFNLSIFSNVFYWSKVISSNLAVICILFSMRSLFKDKERRENMSVVAKETAIDDIYLELNNNKLNTAFNEHIDRENAVRHKFAYVTKLRQGLTRCKNDKKRKRLLEQLEKADTEYDISKVKYNKVKFNTIFGKSKVRFEDNDMDEHEGFEYADILISKIFGVLAFGILTTSFAFDTYAFNLATAYNIVCKILQISIGAYLGAVSGTDYIKGTLLSKLTLRLNFVQQFIEKRAEGR